MTDILAVAILVHNLANKTLDHCPDIGHQLFYPEQVEARGCGDCEDLALWRYEQMMIRNVPLKAMQISVINDGTHAVLDACVPFGRCWRMDHGKPLMEIEALPDKYYDPVNHVILKRGNKDENR